MDDIEHMDILNPTDYLLQKHRSLEIVEPLVFDNVIKYLTLARVFGYQIKL